MRGTQQYVRNTNVLVTSFDTGDAAWEIVDFAPRIPQGLTVHAPIEVVRLIRPLKGRPRLRVDFDPRPEYARVQPTLVETATGIEVLGAAAPLVLLTNLPVPYVLAKRDFALDGPLWFSFTYGRPAEVPHLAQVQRDLDLTIAGWQRWSQTCALPLFQPTRVLRSALCLKLHASIDTGAVIAAATTGIPEVMGTPRCWDYRYCWLRDAAFVVEALRRLSHLQEGEQFLRFVRNVAETGPLQPLYGIDGRRDIEETELPHLAGFGGNGHVRVGNAAVHQRQNDLMGRSHPVPAHAPARPQNRGRRPPAVLPPDTAARRTGHRRRSHERHGNLGISHDHERAHLLASDVLGRDRTRGSVGKRTGP